MLPYPRVELERGRQADYLKFKKFINATYPNLDNIPGGKILDSRRGNGSLIRRYIYFTSQEKYEHVMNEFTMFCLKHNIESESDV